LPSALASVPHSERVRKDDGTALLEALRANSPGASGALFDRYGEHVERVLARVLGIDSELQDLLHEVFVRALAGVADVRDGTMLKSWLTSIAVFTARECIRRRSRRRWLQFLPWGDVPEQISPAFDFTGNEVLRATYALLERLPADERIAFTLRFIEGMELTETASACQVSLATIKRRLARAEARLRASAQEHPAVAEWLEETR
jgi:RNA polymerase sigma-70 factor (ECF subfamily)